MKRAADPAALIIGAAFGTMGVFGLWAHWGLSADDVAELTGFALSAVAAVRMWLARRKG